MILPSGDIVPPELLPGRVGFQVALVIKNNDIAYILSYMLNQLLVTILGKAVSI